MLGMWCRFRGRGGIALRRMVIEECMNMVGGLIECIIVLRSSQSLFVARTYLE